MKLFNKKEEKNKVGRPRLADDETKKKAIISVCIALVMVVALLLTGAFKLNIIKFNKLKGMVTCTEIPARFQPKSESNPEGLHEYGFTDPNFYSAVVSSLYQYSSDATYCTSVTEDQLRGLKILRGSSRNIENTNGIEYLENVEQIIMNNNKNLSEIKLDSNPKITNLELGNNNLTEIDLSNNHNIGSLNLANNPNLKSINLSGNTALTEFNWNYSGHSKVLENLNLNGMTNLNKIHLENTKLNTLDLSTNTNLKNLIIRNNNALYVDLTNNNKLEQLYLKNVSFSDLKSKINLNKLELKNLEIDKLDLTNNKLLKEAYLYDMKIGDLNGVESLTRFYSNNSTIDNLDLTGASSLTSLEISNNTVIDKLDLSDATNLYSINKVPTKVNEINIDNCGLRYITLDNIGLQKVNISNMNNLTQISLERNNINEINIDNMPSLTGLYLNNNNISKININSLPKIENLYINYNKLDEIDLSNFYLLGNLGLVNNNLTGTLDLSNLSKLESIYLAGNKLTDVLLPDSNVSELMLSKNNLSGKLDLSKYKNLSQALLDNNKLDSVIFDSKNLSLVTLNNNNLNMVDFGEDFNFMYDNSAAIILSNNPITNTIYVLKGKTLKYNENINLGKNINISYSIGDGNIASYSDGKIKALNEGVTTIKMANEKIMSAESEYVDKCLYYSDNNQEYCNNVSEEDVILKDFLSQEIKVYDITSDVYKVDKENKTIDASGLDLDVSKIKLTLEGLSGVVDGDNFIIKDGETIVDTYKIINMKKVVDKPSNGTANNKTTTTKRPNSSNKKTTGKKTENKVTTTEDLSDIKLNGTFISILALQQVNGKDRNIIVTNDGITLTINGKDIEKVEGNLDLSYEFKELKESVIYNEVKDKVTSGMVLKFNSNNSLPGKALVNIDVTDIIKKNAGIKNLRLYNYKNGELLLVAKNINSKDKKLSFYVNELGSYVLTDKELTGKNVKEDTKLLESNNKVNKKVSFRCLWWILLILIILGIIGYIIYKKNKDKND